jgi:hypothetical protein
VTPRETLLALAERCEAAEGPDRELDEAIAEALSEWTNIGGHWERHKLTGEQRRTFYLEASAFTDSLDAAVTLVPDGWDWDCGLIRSDAIPGWASCSPSVQPFNAADEQFVEARKVALALCAAALRARAAMEPEQ